MCHAAHALQLEARNDVMQSALEGLDARLRILQPRIEEKLRTFERVRQAIADSNLSAVPHDSALASLSS